MKISPSMLLLCAVCLAGSARAELYKWVDEQGKTHYGDAVPERYQTQKQPLKLDHAPSEADRNEAIQRSQQAQDALRSLEAKRARDAKADRAKRGPKAKDENPNETACQKEWREYLKAKACFQRYRTATGGIRAEAYQHCTEMSEPKTICPP